MDLLSPQVLPAVTALAGVLVTSLFNVWKDSIQSSRERRLRAEKEKRDAYANFITVSTRAQMAALKKDWDLAESVYPELLSAVAMVGVFGSQLAHDCADLSTRVYLTLMAGNGEDAHLARDVFEQFRRLARVELFEGKDLERPSRAQKSQGPEQK